MTISSLHQCLTFPAKTPIQVVRATLIALDKEPLVGQSQYGQYSILSGKLQEGQTQMVVKFFDRQDIGQQMIGQLLVISASEGKKGLTGITIDEHKGTKQLKVNNQAQIILQDTGSPQPPPAYAPPPAWQQPQGFAAPPNAAPGYVQPPQPATPVYPPWQQPDSAPAAMPDPVREAKRVLARIGGRYVNTYVVALYAAREIKRRTGEVLEPEAITKLGTHFSICLEKEGVGLSFEPLDFSGPPPWEELAKASLPPSAAPQLPPSRQQTPPPEPEKPAEDDVPF